MLEIVILGSDNKEQTKDSVIESKQLDKILSKEYTRLSILGETNIAKELY